MTTTVVTALIVALLAMADSAQAADGKSWKNWGAAPFAHSLSEACRKAPEAIDGFALPQKAKEHFNKAVGTMCAGGTEAWLTPGMMLEQMWSGPDSHHKSSYIMNKKPVEYLPVLKSPDGRKYPKDSVGETAKALSWTFAYRGNTYVLYLPSVCFNWSWGFIDTLGPCSRVEYSVMPGDIVVFAFMEKELLPASACLQLCDGDECYSLPSPCDDCNWLDTLSVLPAWLKPLQTGKYVAKSAKQSLRFPKEAASRVYVGIAVTREGLGQSDAWVVQPSEWSPGVTTVKVPYGGQQWPAWGKVDLSKWRNKP